MVADFASKETGKKETLSDNFLIRIKIKLWLNARTYRGGGGVDPPIRFSWVFSLGIKHQHLTFSVAVCSSLAHILRQVQWWSVAVVMRYDITSSRWTSHFWVKVLVFSTSLNNSATTHKIYLILLRRSMAFHLNKKKCQIVLKYCNISKTPGRGYIPPPSPTVPQWGMKFLVPPRVKALLCP